MLITFVLTLSARLPPRTARAVAATQSVLLLLPQRRACVGILSNRPATLEFFLATARVGRAGVRWVVGALLSDGLAPLSSSAGVSPAPVLPWAAALAAYTPNPHHAAVLPS